MLKKHESIAYQTFISSHKTPSLIISPIEASQCSSFNVQFEISFVHDTAQSSRHNIIYSTMIDILINTVFV